MASLIFSHAKQIDQKIKNKIKEHIEILEKCNIPIDNDKIEEYKNKLLQTEIETFQEIVKISKQLHSTYLINCTKNEKHFFITIRPDDKKIKFIDFYNKIYTFLHRKCIKSYFVTFEQKGMSVTDLGNGFHTHIICTSDVSGIKNMLKNTQSTFKDCTAPNCIEVKHTFNKDELKDRYLIDYESNDNHKFQTKEWDTLWRNKYNIKEYYENNMEPLSVISSPFMTESNCIIKWNL